MADIFDAYLDGILLEMETIDDTFGKVIAKYAYPYADGDDLEDMGQKGRSVRLRCYFIDNDTQQTYDAHISLLNSLAYQTEHSLNHPKYGQIQGQIEDVVTRHNDRQRCAEVELTFLERMRQPIEIVPPVEVVSASEGDFQTCQDQQMDSLDADLSDEGLDTTAELDPEETLLDQMSGLSNTAREMVRELDGYIAQISATANSVLQPVNSLVATITYAANLPGRVLGIVSHAVERMARLYDSIANFPTRFLGNLKFAMDKLVVQIAGRSTGRSAGVIAARQMMIKHVKIACAQRFALEAAYLYAADETERQKVRKSENTAAWDALGRYSAPADQAAQIMTINDLEGTLAGSRQFLQEAIDLDRTITGLKGLALDLLTHVTEVKLERDKIITVVIDNPLPLHLICLKYGLPYNYAERIYSINSGLANPTSVEGPVQIYVR